MTHPITNEMHEALRIRLLGIAMAAVHTPMSEPPAVFDDDDHVEAIDLAIIDAAVANAMCAGVTCQAAQEQ